LAAQDRTIEVREWGAVHRVLQVGGGGAGMLAVPENANTGWVATLDGHRLTSRTIDGWQQGWLLPAGGAGRVRLDFAPDRSYRAALAGGGIGVGLLLLVTLWSCLRRRSTAPEPAGTGRRAPLLVKAGLAVAVAAVLAGGWGVAALLVGMVLLRLLRGRTWVPVVALMSAAVVASVTGLAAGVGAIRAEQLLALLAVLTVIGAAVVDREPD
jgi:arabinofuranan 3-O-arabinosyltransferase